MASATAGEDVTEEEASSRPTRRRRRDGMYIFRNSNSNQAPYLFSDNVIRTQFNFLNRQSR